MVLEIRKGVTAFSVFSENKHKREFGIQYCIRDMLACMYIYMYMYMYSIYMYIVHDDVQCTCTCTLYIVTGLLSTCLVSELYTINVHVWYVAVHVHCEHLTCTAAF